MKKQSFVELHLVQSNDLGFQRIYRGVQRLKSLTA